MPAKDVLPVEPQQSAAWCIAADHCLSARVVIESGKRFTYPRAWDTGPRQRAADILLVPERGTLLASSQASASTDEFRVAPGEALWLPRGQVQRIAAAAGPVQFLSIHSISDGTFGLPLCARAHCGPREAQSYPVWIEGIARLAEQPTKSSTLLAHGLRQQWLTWVAHHPELVAAAPTLPNELILAVQVAHQQPNIGPEQLAQACGCSLVTLRRRFLAHFEMTPGKWLSEQRLQRAAHLLRTSSDTVRKIAESAGFSDERYLHQCFRARYGCTPLTYREGGP